MANYYDPNKYSLIDSPEFQTAYSNYRPNQMADVKNEPFMSPEVARSAAYGAQSGGLSGALISGGTTSLLTSGAAAGGPYAIAGGLILSQIEAAQKAKAEQEAQKIQAEKEKQAKMMNVYAKMANQKFGI